MFSDSMQLFEVFFLILNLDFYTDFVIHLLFKVFSSVV